MAPTHCLLGCTFVALYFCYIVDEQDELATTGLKNISSNIWRYSSYHVEKLFLSSKLKELA